MGLSDKELVDLEVAAFVHDIGKVGVPDQILHKPGPLTRGEFNTLRNYPFIGERILSAVPGLWRVSKIVRSHHEQYDGSGYPDGLSSDSIPLAARILNAAEAFLALVSERLYRRVFSLEDAIEVLQKEAGKSFDPDVIRILVRLLETDRVKYTA